MNSVQHQSPPSGSIDDLIRQMESLRRMVEEQAEQGDVLAGLPPERRRAHKTFCTILQSDMRTSGHYRTD